MCFLFAFIFGENFFIYFENENFKFSNVKFRHLKPSFEIIFLGAERTSASVFSLAVSRVFPRF